MIELLQLDVPFDGAESPTCVTVTVPPQLSVAGTVLGGGICE
jgi:hypothetical protein